AERLAFELLRRGDVLVLHRIDRERRDAVNHEYGLRRVVGMLGREHGERVDVAEADVVGAACDARHRRARSLTLIHLHVETFGFEVALVLGEEEPRLRALIFPIEDEADFYRIGGVAGGRVRHRGGTEQRDANEIPDRHFSSPLDWHAGDDAGVGFLPVYDFSVWYIRFFQ